MLLIRFDKRGPGFTVEVLFTTIDGRQSEEMCRLESGNLPSSHQCVQDDESDLESNLAQIPLHPITSREVTQTPQ